MWNGFSNQGISAVWVLERDGCQLSGSEKAILRKNAKLSAQQQYRLSLSLSTLYIPLYHYIIGRLLPSCFHPHPLSIPLSSHCCLFFFIFLDEIFRWKFDFVRLLLIVRVNLFNWNAMPKVKCGQNTQLSVCECISSGFTEENQRGVPI